MTAIDPNGSKSCLAYALKQAGIVHPLSDTPLDGSVLAMTRAAAEATNQVVLWERNAGIAFSEKLPHRNVPIAPAVVREQRKFSIDRLWSFLRKGLATMALVRDGRKFRWSALDVVSIDRDLDVADGGCITTLSFFSDVAAGDGENMVFTNLMALDHLLVHGSHKAHAVLFLGPQTIDASDAGVLL
jgi:hypothetical protein